MEDKRLDQIVQVVGQGMVDFNDELLTRFRLSGYGIPIYRTEIDPLSSLSNHQNEYLFPPTAHTIPFKFTIYYYPERWELAILWQTLKREGEKGWRLRVVFFIRNKCSEICKEDEEAFIVV